MHLTQKFFASGYAAIVMFLLLAIAPHASAQFAMYNTLTMTNRHTNETNQNVNFTATGLGAGLFYDGHRFGRLSVGADVRGSIASNDKFGLLGFRAALQPKEKNPDIVPIRPYAEMLLGGGTSANIHSGHDAHMIVEGAVGLDCIFQHLEYRILEVAFGRTPMNNTTGTNYTGGDLWLISESSGLVYHF